MKYKKTISTIITAALLSSVFIFRPYVVTGGSMEPTYSEGTVVLAEKLSHRLYVSRGDIIVMRNPHQKEVIEVKRVIGLPNETVQLGSEGVTVSTEIGKGAPWHCQGAPLVCKLEFPAGTTIGGEYNGPFRIKLGPEDYLVLGDNRSKSSDSRAFGAVQKADIIGRVMIKL